MDKPATPSLASSFLPHRAADDPVCADSAALEEALSVYLSAAVAAWPALAVPHEVFLAYAAARRPAAPLAKALDPTFAGDLYLACACAGGVPAALAAFEARYLVEVPQILRHILQEPADRYEIAAQLRSLFFVPGADGTPPRITRYEGRGALGGWVRVAAVRAGLNLRRDRAPRRETRLSEIDVVSGNIELDYLRQRHQQDFAAALAGAFDALAPDERLLLRLRYVDGVGAGKLAVILGLHRSGVSRRLQSVHEKIFAGVKQRLKGMLGLDSAEFDSLLRLMGSDLDVSLAVHLAEKDG